MAKPQMNLDHASPIALDARQGKPVTSTVERSGARLVQAVAYARDSSFGGWPGTASWPRRQRGA